MIIPQSSPLVAPDAAAQGAHHLPPREETASDEEAPATESASASAGTGTTGATGSPALPHAISPAERAMLAAFDAQRRLALLRIVVPGMFAVVIAALPFAIQADIATQSLNSTVQMGI